MAEIAVVGAGYVGLVTGACWARLGHNVTFLDVDEAKIQLLRSGSIPIYEPHLEEFIREGTAARRISFTLDPAEAIPGREFVFVAVHTPSATNGNTDLMALINAVHSLAGLLSPGAVVVQKSTAPVGTSEFVARIVAGRNGNGKSKVQVVANPEFLREGTAINDFLNPDRVVLGSTDEEAAARVAELYSYADCPVIITDANTAEMIKYASNAFLASKISFINEIAQICDAAGIDARKVADGMGHDPRIGRQFLGAGLGWGGSCLPKDVKSIIHMAKSFGVDPGILESVQAINDGQRQYAADKLERMLGGLDGAVIGLLGLAFKPDTDDLRHAPSIHLSELLLARGALPRAYDPVAMDPARQLMPGVAFCPDAYSLAGGADALVLVTEWPEFRELDMAAIHRRMRRHVLVDGRNIWDGAEMRELGFSYAGFGVPGSDNSRQSATTLFEALGNDAETLGIYP